MLGFQDCLGAVEVTKQRDIFQALHGTWIRMIFEDLTQLLQSRGIRFGSSTSSTGLHIAKPGGLAHLDSVVD